MAMILNSAYRLQWPTCNIRSMTVSECIITLSTIEVNETDISLNDWILK